MPRKKITVDKQQLLDAIERSPSLLQASKSLDLKFATFKRRCAEFGIEPQNNQGGKGYVKPALKLLHDMSNKGSIKRRLLEEVADECAECKLPPIWMGKRLSLHLDHIDGNRKNNRRENLRLLCPNCHSQTPTWGVKNAKFMKDKAGVAKLVAAQGSEPCGLK